MIVRKVACTENITGDTRRRRAGFRLCAEAVYRVPTHTIGTVVVAVAALGAAVVAGERRLLAIPLHAVRRRAVLCEASGREGKEGVER